jgi:putative spermidine/putrescine transport system ATP-binding protein
MDQTKVKLRIDGIHKAYGEVVALHATSLDVREGEFVTLLGPSGSGKTTLLHSVAGLTEPDGGRIWIDGTDVTRQAPFKRDLGMVFQNYALFPHLNVFENIAFPLRMRRCSSSEIDQRVKEALALVQLGHAASRLPRELSGGQQQRVALARCVVYKPSIVLMDEPLGALDRKLREQMQTEIRRIHRELGTTMLYVTHDQEEAMTLSDRIILMRNGRIEQAGSPRNLYIEPASTYAADFLGESNLLAATLVSSSTVALTANGASPQVRCVPRPDLQTGQAVRCFVRPEVIRLLAQGESADNAFEGTIEQVILAGGVTRYAMALEVGVVLRANVLTSTDSGSRSAGEKVRVGFSARDARILTGEESGG